jgi:hypothetical protein
MAKVKYRIREFKPSANQTGGHSFYAEAVVDNIITNKELAKKVEARTGMRSYEVQTALAAIAEIIMEETAENNRIQLESDGAALVSIYPTCSGSVSDKDVQANPEKYDGATAATADMLTADKIKWTLGATIGRKFSALFSMNKQAQRVDYNEGQTPAVPDDTTGGSEQTGGGTQGGNDDGENEGA